MDQAQETLVAGFLRRPLPTICALLVGAVVYLFLQTLSIQTKKEAIQETFRLYVVESERRCSEKIDAVRLEHYKATEAALVRLQRVEDELLKKYREDKR